MDYHQLMRIDRCYNEQFFLLEKTKKDSNLIIVKANPLCEIYNNDIN